MQVKLCVAKFERFGKCIWYLQALYKCPGLRYLQPINQHRGGHCGGLRKWLPLHGLSPGPLVEGLLVIGDLPAHVNHLLSGVLTTP